jgi:hypothetical protein
MLFPRFKSYGEHSDAELLRTYGFATLADQHIFLHGEASCCDVSHANPYIFSILGPSKSTNFIQSFDAQLHKHAGCT